MNLKEKLNTIAADFAKQVDPAMMATMKIASQQLFESGILDDTVIPGDRAPEFTLTDGYGLKFSSIKLHTNGPLVINFYRGVW